MKKALSTLLFLGALASPAAALDGTLPSRDGATILFHVEGPAASERPAIVFVHCWACDRHLWDRTLPLLAKTYRVITLDLAGHGGSTSGTRKDFTIAAFAEDVSTVVESVGPKKVILVGHSMGGPVVLEAARRLGSRVVGIVPVDTLTHVDGGLGPEELDAFFAPFLADYPAAVEKFIRGWMFLPAADPKLIEGIVARAVATPSEVGLSALQNAFRNDARPALRELRVPIHALNADKFPTDLDAARRYAPQFDATILKGHGHYLMLENPSEFGEALGRILLDMSATAAEPGSETRAALFDEDSTVPLDVRRGRAKESEGITEMDVLFPSPTKGNVPATLVFPPGAGPFAGVIFMHPRGEAGSQREYFLSEARALAPAGVVSLLIDAPFARPDENATPLFGITNRDRDDVVQSVVDVRRGLDVLGARSQVDAHRIAFVGAGYGATVGAILAGVEKRFKAFVLISGAAKVTTLLRALPTPEVEKLEDSGVLDVYLARMAAVDSDQWVARPRSAPILFQWGERDLGVPPASAAALFEAARGPKDQLSYAAAFEMIGRARNERAEWLAPRLELLTKSNRPY